MFPAGPANTDPHYERVFLLDPQYQNPAVLRNKLPELSQSAEASGIELFLDFFNLQYIYVAGRDFWEYTRIFLEHDFLSGKSSHLSHLRKYELQIESLKMLPIFCGDVCDKSWLVESQSIS